MTDAPHPVGISEQRHATGQHLLGVAQIASAVKVEGQRYISQFGESIGPAALDVAEPHALRSEQHRGPAVDTGREGEVPDHRQTVGRILDRTRRNRCHEAGLY
ncbi:hypothetical protein SHKM778_55330 [Streptomyces sp. KM77-8]|uniref:Uncharacterized protein n=1 Tax=Streptomyces haneummycinicus TaxID=3074435 RepID=A0AAT9HNV0_9ACTN